MKPHFPLLDALLRHRQILFIIIGITIAFGIFALLMMPRDEYPDFTIRQGLIVGIYPGATAEQVEAQLAAKVEHYLYQYKSVDRAKTTSISKENLLVMYVEVSPEEKDPDAFWAKLRHGLNDLKSQLPAGVQSLTADNDFGNTSALLIAVQSDTRSYRELETVIQRFEDDVRQVPSVSRVKRYGTQRERITVAMDDAVLTHYGVKPLIVLSALKPQSMIAYAGEVDDGVQVRPVHVPATFSSIRDVENQIVFSDPMGTVLRVKDVARVFREYETPESFIRTNGQSCIIVSLEMREGQNIVQFGKEVQEAIDRFGQSLPDDVTISTITNQPDVVATAIEEFLKEFAISILVVIVVTVLLLPKRVALVAASSIPVSILITLGAMWLIGINLQTVSLASLIIVLGMVVDNAIVIVDNYVEKLDASIAPREAASRSVQELFGSVFSATLILIVSFAPIPFFMVGTAGDFVLSLPTTVFIALFTSLLVSVLLVPVLCFLFIKHGIRRERDDGSSASFLARVQRGYNRLIEAAFRAKKTVVMVGAGSFLLGLVLLAIVPQQSFPKIERNQFAVEVELPVGASLEQTDQVIRVIEDTLRRDPRVTLVSAFVGTGSPRFHTLYAPKFPEKNIGQLIVVTESKEATEEILNEYWYTFRDRFPRAQVKMKQLEMAGASAPIEVRVSGDSLAAIQRTAERIADLIRPVPGAYWVRTDYKEPRQSIDIQLNKDEATRLGYSGTLLGYSLMVGTRGFPVSTVWEGDYPVDITLTMKKPHRMSVQDLKEQYITSPFLASAVQLRQIAEVSPGWSEGQIVRRNGIRTITVLAEIERNAFASTVFARIRPDIEKLPLPDGVHISYGGEYQDSKENMTPFLYSFAVSLVLIFLILMGQFRSIKTSLLIMGTMPLSLFGAAFGLFVTGYPFSVTAFIGVIGLMGIVVRNGIIYIAYAEELRRNHGHTLLEAAVSSAQRRMRPIFLTSAAAAMGVVPMIMSGSSLWGPLGSVVCFGLIFGMILSLLVMPVLYYLFHRKDFDTIEEPELA